MPGFPIGELIAAGGSIVSKLLEKKPKVISPAQQIRDTVAGARDAGVHPLAALGSGAGYTQVGGNPSTGSAIGEGIARLGASLANQKTEEEIGQIRADTEARKAQADLYRAQSRSVISNMTNSVRGGPSGVNSKDDPVKPVNMFGVTLNRNPDLFSSAQRSEDEYGDVVQQIVGTGSAIEAGSRAMLKAYDNTAFGKADRKFSKRFYDWWAEREKYRFNKGNYTR